MNYVESITNFVNQTGFVDFFRDGNWKCLVMILISCVLFYLAIVKKFEPLLLLPIAFGMLLTNIPGAALFHEEFFAGGHIQWSYFADGSAGLIDILYLGVKLGIYPCLIFIGVGAMTDFGPLIAPLNSVSSSHMPAHVCWALPLPKPHLSVLSAVPTVPRRFLSHRSSPPPFSVR